MNTNIKTITYGLLGAALLSGCADNWEQTPIDAPTFPAGTKANTTIAQLKDAYWQDNDSYGTQIGLTEDGDSIIIIGTAVSSTTAGNIYKTLVLQDATGAITIGINDSDVSGAFPQGLAVKVNVTGMYIGRYSGLMQLGKQDGSGVNRIDLADFKPRTALDFFQGNMDTTTVTIPEMIAASKSPATFREWQSRLVRIDNVKFIEAGEPFTNGSNTSRYIVDDEGNRMIVYNSPYADFAYESLPWGHGSVVGILSCYRTSWQILLNDTAGLIDFDGEGAPDPNLTTLLKESFASSSLGEFTIEDILLGTGLNHVWAGTDSYGAKASAYVNGCIESDSYLVSPVVDLTGCTAPKLTFSHCVNKFDGTGYLTQATLQVREVAETPAQWEQVTIPQYSSNADWNFTDSGDIDLSKFQGKKIQFAFRYTSTNSVAGTWEIKNVALTAIKTPADK